MLVVSPPPKKCHLLRSFIGTRFNEGNQGLPDYHGSNVEKCLRH